MRRSIQVVIALLFSASCLAGSDQESDSAIAWLEIVDSESYVESWNQAAPFFKGQLSSAKWEQVLNQVRTPLGKVLSRKVTNTSLHSSLPGAPDGEYMIITLATSYEHKKTAIETVTISKAKGSWRVAGYFIK